MNWQPTASMPMLRKRAEMLTQIRSFFAEKAVLEVETPSLSNNSVTDVHLRSFETQLFAPGDPKGTPLYLVTSPEYHMKRLLCAGSGSIYQISHSFRNEETGRVHNPEFTMLEWYRPSFDHHQLMDEVDELLIQILGCKAAERISYQHAFFSVLGIDPLAASLAELKAACRQYVDEDIADQEKSIDTLLQLLFSARIEPEIGQVKPTMVFDFPASQAALARISNKDERVAARFEVYFKGLELANGYHELSDPKEQLARFKSDNRTRLSRGQTTRAIDPRFIAALKSGLPDCAGVALGIDRLLMLRLDAKSLSEVMAFPIHIA